MYIYGGNDIREGPLDTLWAFELEKVGELRELADTSPGPDAHAKLEWNKVETTGRSPGRISHHATVVSGDRMILIGGSCDGLTSARLHSLNLKSFNWESHLTSGY